jgi:hypothetical protein
MTQDEQHLNLISILHFVFAGLQVLISGSIICILMLYGATNKDDAPPILSGGFLIFAVLVVILESLALTGLMVASGLKLRRRTSRTFCLAAAGIECLWTPFGTVLGILTIVLLMKDSVKALFEGPKAA